MDVDNNSDMFVGLKLFWESSSWYENHPREGLNRVIEILLQCCTMLLAKRYLFVVYTNANQSNEDNDNKSDRSKENEYKNFKMI